MPFMLSICLSGWGMNRRRCPIACSLTKSFLLRALPLPPFPLHIQSRSLSMRTTVQHQEPESLERELKKRYIVCCLSSATIDDYAESLNKPMTGINT